MNKETVRTYKIDGKTYNMTPAEEDARDLEEQTWADEQTELAKTQYQRDRASEYPDYREYLDAIVKGDDVQKQKYIDDCLAIKAAHPKP